MILGGIGEVVVGWGISVNSLAGNFYLADRNATRPSRLGFRTVDQTNLHRDIHVKFVT